MYDPEKDLLMQNNIQQALNNQALAQTLVTQYNEAVGNLQAQADTAISQATGNTLSALEAKNQYNMKATMLENQLTNIGIPVASAPAGPSAKKPILILAIAVLGYFYWKGKIKL